MDQSTFTNLTGQTLSESQEDRFETVAELAQQELETLLGWPLDPSSDDNEYIEIGKTANEGLSCSDVDPDDLDAPDAVVGSYRLFPYDKRNVYHKIDPASDVHAVKLVKILPGVGGVTCNTLDEFGIRLPSRGAGYIEICNSGDCPELCICSCENDCFQLAVDADWNFAPAEDEEWSVDSLPIELQKVLADMIGEQLDGKSDIRSESFTSHSYTKFDRESVGERHQLTLDRYTGPRGTFRRSRLV